MKKQFVINLILLVVLNLLIKPFWIFGIDIEVQNLVGAEQYGFYFSLFNFSVLMNMVLDMGIVNYNQRHIAQNHDRLADSLNGFIGLKLLLAVAYVAVSFCVGFLLGYGWQQLHLLMFLLINQTFISFTQYWRSNISGLHHFITDSFLSVLDKLLMIIICSVLLFSSHFRNSFTIEWFVYGQTSAYAITWLIAALVVFCYSGRLKIRIQWSKSISMVRKTAPYALLVLLMAIYSRIDSVMLERMLPDGKIQVGIYAQAFRLMDAGSMFGVLFAGLLLPMFSRMLKKRESISGLFNISTKLIIIPAVTTWVICIHYSPQIINILYHHHIEDASRLLPVLMGSFVFICLGYIWGTLLTANGSLKALNLMSIIGVLLNVTLNFIFIPKFQALGAAYTSFITQAIIVLLQLFMIIRIFSFKIETKLVIKTVFFLVLIFAIGYISRTVGHWLGAITLIVSSSILLSFLLRLFDIKILKDFFSLKSYKQQL